MKKFILVLNVGLQPTKDAITNYLRAKGWPIWHWFENLWLLSNVPDNVTAQSLSEEILALIAPIAPGPLTSHIVIDASDKPSAYFGRGPKEGWEWMLQNWGRPDGAPAEPEKVSPEQQP